MQAYNDGKLMEMLMGTVSDLEERKNKLLSSGKATKVNIGILPKIGTEVIIDSLAYEVTNVNEFGKVIMMLKRPS